MKSWIILMSLLASGHSFASEVLTCSPTESQPHSTSYLLILQEGLPGEDKQGVILSAESKDSKDWTLVHYDAKVTRIATSTGNNTKVFGSDQSKPDWSKEENDCFARKKDDYRFNLATRAGSTIGSVTTYLRAIPNPNRKRDECPIPSPPQPITVQLDCRPYP